MEIIAINGIPGSGKTLLATDIAIKHYKKYNPSETTKTIWKLTQKISKKNREKMDYINMWKIYNEKGKVVPVYSNYPILLDKKNNIYSQPFNIDEFNNSISFIPNSIFIIDEIQLQIDSDEYKDKDQKERIKYIAKFMQASRHFGADGIILISQHPSRIFKKARNVISEYWQCKKLLIGKLTKIAILKIQKYYNLDDYGKYIPKDREQKEKISFEYKIKYQILNCNKLFDAYDSRYLAKYNYNKPLKKIEFYNSKKMEIDKIQKIFND